MVKLVKEAKTLEHTTRFVTIPPKRTSHLLSVAYGCKRILKEHSKAMAGDGDPCSNEESILRGQTQMR